jgi:hydrogenase maturation protease
MSRDRQRSGGAEVRFLCSSAPLPLCSSAPPRTLVLGLGNPILGDDGVGWRVVEEVERRVRNDALSRQSDAAAEAATTNLEFDCISLGGLALMERLVGYDRAILVDAIQTPDGVPGTIYRLTLDDLPTLNANSAHDASLKAALALGRRLGARLPEDVVILAIEAANVLDFSEILSPGVAASVGQTAETLVKELALGSYSESDKDLGFSIQKII